MLHFRNPFLIWVSLLGAMKMLALTAFASDQMTEEFHRTVPLPSNGRVSLNNINCNVTQIAIEHAVSP